MRDKGQISKILSGCQCFTSVTSRWKQINTVVGTFLNRHFLKEPKRIWNSCSDVPALTNKVCKITWNASCINIAYIHAKPSNKHQTHSFYHTTASFPFKHQRKLHLIKLANSWCTEIMRIGHTHKSDKSTTVIFYFWRTEKFRAFFTASGTETTEGVWELQILRC